MAEYACGRRCVRAAARGFSPGGGAGMLRQKAGHSLLFQFMLEGGGPLKQAAHACASQQMAAAIIRKTWIYPQKRKFLRKDTEEMKAFACPACFAIAFDAKMVYRIMGFRRERQSRKIMEKIHMNGQANKGERR